MFKATSVQAIYAYKTVRKGHTYFLVEVVLNLADGTRKSVRKHYPTIEIAEIVKRDLSQRNDHIIECANAGVEWTRSPEVDDAYRKWISTLTLDERLAFAGQKHSPSAELDPELSLIVEERERERLARITAEREQIKAAKQKTIADRKRKQEGRKTASRVSRVSLCVYQQKPSTSFILEIIVTSHDGKKRVRRSYPTKEIAELAKSNLSQREDLIECVNRGVIFDSEAQKAVDELMSEAQKKRDELKRRRKIEKARLRATKRKQAEELRIQRKQLASMESQKRRNPEEIEDAKRRGLETATRNAARRRERLAASEENRPAFEHARKLSSEVVRNARLKKREERRQNSIERLRQKRELQERIAARAESERLERSEHDEFAGANYIRTMCDSGLIAREQALSLVRLDADPDEIIAALQVADHDCIAGTIDKLVASNKSIPAWEQITRFSIQFYSRRCRAEFQQLKSLIVEQSEEEEPDWMFIEPNAVEFSQAL